MTSLIETAADALLSGKLAWSEFDIAPIADRAALIDRLESESDESLRISLAEAGLLSTPRADRLAAIRSQLFRAAERAEQFRHEPATTEQCRALAGLLADAGYEGASTIECDPCNQHAMLTKGLAREWISHFLAQRQPA